MIALVLAALGALAAWKGLSAPTVMASPTPAINTGQSLTSQPGSGTALKARGGTVTPLSGATPVDTFNYKHGTVWPVSAKQPLGIQPAPVRHPVDPLPPAIGGNLISPARPRGGI